MAYSILLSARKQKRTQELMFDLPNCSALFSISLQTIIGLCMNLHKYSTNKQKSLAQKFMQSRNVCKCIIVTYTHPRIDHVCVVVNSSTKQKNKNKSDKNAAKITLLLFSRHIVRLFYASSAYSCRSCLMRM